MENKVYVFVGCYFENNLFDFFSKKYFKGKISVSNREYEKMLFNGFLNAKKNAYMISAPSVGRYPQNCKKMFFKKQSSSKYNRVKYCSFCTIYGVSKYSKSLALKKEFKKIMKENNPGNVIVIACEAHKPYLDVIKLAKKKFNCKTCLIVPDLPEYMMSNNSKFYHFFKKRDINSIYQLANKFVDYFVFFTKFMKNKFDLSNKNYILREGIIDDFVNTNETNKLESKECTYIGKTNMKNGINLLIEVAKLLPDINFNIYGNGDMDSVLKTTNLNNLKFHGFLNPECISEVIKKTNVFVSLRYPNQSYTAFSFPSKILKYIQIGKPIVTFKLPCYESYYDELLIYPKDYSPEEVACCIRKAFNSLDSDYIAKVRTNLGHLLAKNIVNDLCQMFDKKL